MSPQTEQELLAGQWAVVLPFYSLDEPDPDLELFTAEAAALNRAREINGKVAEVRMAYGNRDHKYTGITYKEYLRDLPARDVSTREASSGSDGPGGKDSLGWFIMNTDLDNLEFAETQLSILGSCVLDRESFRVDALRSGAESVAIQDLQAAGVEQGGYQIRMRAFLFEFETAFYELHNDASVTDVVNLWSSDEIRRWLLDWSRKLSSQAPEKEIQIEVARRECERMIARYVNFIRIRGPRAGLGREVDRAPKFEIAIDRSHVLEATAVAIGSVSVPPSKPEASNASAENNRSCAEGEGEAEAERSPAEPVVALRASTGNKRGRPIKISDERKIRALAITGGKARAQILYNTPYPDSRQVRNVSSILKHFQKKTMTAAE